MPKVPERPLSPGEIHRTYIRSSDNFHGTKDVPEYHFKEPNKNSKNGAIKTTKLPPPFKCSKCLYVGVNRKALDVHWELEH